MSFHVLKVSASVGWLLLVPSCTKLDQPVTFNQIVNFITRQITDSPGDHGSRCDEGKGLIGYWPFDESSGTTAIDKSGNGHDGTLINAKRVPGKIGTALAFSGCNSGVDICDCDGLAVTGSFTISAWIKPTGVKATHGLVFFRGDSRPGLDPYLVTVYPDSTLRFQIQDSTQTAEFVETKVPFNVWIHVCAVYDAARGSLQLFLGGKPSVRKATCLRPFAVLDSTQMPGVGIGHHALRQYNDYGFIGMIDEVRLHDYPLSSNEVVRLVGAASELASIAKVERK